MKSQLMSRIPSALQLTSIFMGISIAVYVAQVASGVSWAKPTTNALLDWGGNTAFLTLTGDYWRLLSSLFLHAGLFHLLANMYMLFLVGPRVEKWFGRWAFTGIYLIGGLWAALVIPPLVAIFRSRTKRPWPTAVLG